MKTVVSRQANESTDQASTNRTIGIQRSPKLGTSAKSESTEKPDIQTQLQLASQYGYSIGNIPLQAKLVVGQPGDRYEQEADHLASQAVTGATSGTISTVEKPTVQQDAATQTNTGVEMGAIAEAVPDQPAVASVLEANGVTLDSAGATGNTADAADPNSKANSLEQMDTTGLSTVGADSLESDIQQAKAQGSESLPLDMQQRLREQLGMENPEEICIHNDATAHDLCKRLAAHAFTTENHIFFASGQYNPDTPQGQELIFHEAVHTMQQGAIRGSAVPPTPPPGGDAQAVDQGGTEALSTEVPVQAKSASPWVQLFTTDPVATEEDPEKQIEAVKEQVPSKDGGVSDSAATETDPEKQIDATRGQARNIDGAEAQAQLENTDLVKAAESEAGPVDTPAVDDIAADATPQSGGIPAMPDFVPEAIADTTGSDIDIDSLGENIDTENLDAVLEGEDSDIISQFGGGVEIPEEFYRQAVRQEVFQSFSGVNPPKPPSPLAAMSKRDIPLKQFDPPPWLGNPTSKEGKAKDNIGFQLLRNVALGGATAKGIEIYNTFVGILDGTETNPFGIYAALTEMIIKGLEIVTGILTAVTLALTTVAAILFLIGLPLLALFGVGKIFIAIAKKMMLVVKKIAVITAKIAAVRLVLRLVAITLRGLDYLYSKAMGATAEELQRKQDILTNQAVGIAVDAVSVVLAPKGVFPGKDKVMAAIGSKVAPIKDALVGKLTAAKDGIKNWAVSKFTTIKSKLASKATNSGSGLTDKIKSFGESGWKKIKSVLPKSEGPGLKDKLKENFGKAKEAWNDKHSGIFWDGSVNLKTRNSLLWHAPKNMATGPGVTSLLGLYDGYKKEKDRNKLIKSSVGDVAKDAEVNRAFELYQENKEPQEQDKEGEHNKKDKSEQQSEPKSSEKAGDAKGDKEDEDYDQIYWLLMSRNEARQAQYEQTLQALPPIPYEKLAHIDVVETNLTLCQVEQAEIDALQATSMGMMIERQESIESVASAQEDAAVGQAAIAQGNFLLNTQIGIAQNFTEQAEELGGQSSKNKAGMAMVGAKLKGVQPGIQEGAHQAAKEGKDDPSLHQTGQADAVMNQGGNQAEQGMSLSQIGIAGGQASAQKSQQQIEQGDQAIAQINTFQEAAEERQNQSASEIQELSDECEELNIARQEVQAQKEQAHEERMAALAEVAAWAEHSRSLIDAYLTGSLSEEEANKVENELVDEDSEQEPAEALQEFEALVEAIAAEIHAQSKESVAA